MRSKTSNRVLFWFSRMMQALLLASVVAPLMLVAQSKSAAAGGGTATFPSAQAAADALVNAAAKHDPDALLKIFGQGAHDLLFTNEPPLDIQRVEDFAAQAREKMSISVEPKNGNHAYILVGNGEWPFPIPLVNAGGKWHFDTAAGSKEVLYRRIGSNELDAIQICDGFVEAQHEYAFKKRDGYQVNQYAQQIVSTPGKQDGLAWKNPDGSWGGPIGSKIALAISEGYSNKDTPYHGYYFKVLKGQGPAAPLGQLDYVIKGMMIGGFALVAAPAEYRVSGVKTFMVSQDGVVWQKDLGPTTLDQFKAMDRFNPDKSWSPVEDNP